MDKSDLFDFGRKLYSRYAFSPKTGIIKMPIRYVFELTYRCNLSCPFCYIKGERAANELTTEQWLGITDQIPPFSMISFVAGEVLLRPDFDVIFERANQKFRKTTLITNGLRLDENISELLVRNNLMLLSVSLDGIGENHDKSRNHPGLYDKVVKNIEVFNEKRKDKKNVMLDVKTCILPENLEDLPKLYEKAQELNAQFFSLTFIREQPLRQNSVLFDEFSEEFYLKNYPIRPYFDIDRFAEIYRELEEKSKKTGTILRYAPRFKPRGDIEKIKSFFASYDKPVTELYHPCNIPMSAVFINPEGIVYPCLSYKTADLKEVSLKEAVNCIKLRCFRKNLHASKIFTGCQMCCDAIPR